MIRVVAVLEVVVVTVMVVAVVEDSSYCDLCG